MPSRKSGQIIFKAGGNISEDSWDEEPRKEERYTRIRNRVPTGHPGLAKKLLRKQVDLDLGSDEDQPCDAGGLHDRTSDDPVHFDVPEQGVRDAPDTDMYAVKPSKSKQRKSASTKDSTATSSKKKKEKSSSSKRESSKKKKASVTGSEMEDEEDVEPEVFVKTVKVGSSSKKKGATKDAMHIEIGKATVIAEDGDTSWSEEDRKKERFSRIRKRVPTGHPGLAKKVEQLRQQELDDATSEEVEVVVRDGVSEEDTEASPPQKTTRKKATKDRNSSKSSKSKKQKEAIKFGEVKAINDSDSDGSWSEKDRKEERFKRIRTRVPTGHPGLAKKVAGLRSEMESIQDEAKRKKSSSSSQKKQVRV